MQQRTLIIVVIIACIVWNVGLFVGGCEYGKSKVLVTHMADTIWIPQDTIKVKDDHATPTFAFKENPNPSKIVTISNPINYDSLRMIIYQEAEAYYKLQANTNNDGYFTAYKDTSIDTSGFTMRMSFMSRIAIDPLGFYVYDLIFKPKPTAVITKTTTLNCERTFWSRFAFGLQGGYYYLTDIKEFHPGVGVGFSFNF